MGVPHINMEYDRIVYQAISVRMSRQNDKSDFGTPPFSRFIHRFLLIAFPRSNVWVAREEHLSCWANRASVWRWREQKRLQSAYTLATLCVNSVKCDYFGIFPQILSTCADRLGWPISWNRGINMLRTDLRIYNIIITFQIVIWTFYFYDYSFPIFFFSAH